MFWAYKGRGILVMLWGILCPGRAFSKLGDLGSLGLMVMVVVSDFLADCGVRAKLFTGSAFLMVVKLLLPVNDVDLLCMDFLFHTGVRVTLSGVIPGGDRGGDWLSVSPAASSWW